MRHQKPRWNKRGNVPLHRLFERSELQPRIPGSNSLHSNCQSIKLGYSLSGTNRSGFTLLELIVTSVLAAMVMLSVYSVFNSGINVWNATYEAGSTDNIYLNIERLNRELAGILNFAPVGFTCESGKITFPALVMAPTQASNLPETLPIDNPTEPEKSFARPGWISYRFNADKTELLRAQGVYGEPFNDDNYRVIISNLDEVNFSYTSETAAGNTEQDFLPQTVKIEIKAKDKIFTRTIYIPLSRAAKNEQRR
ncbi:MAG: prepilin-type N-terminal cleavage/methylation domain-containing protein [Planctomycetota bacterium]